MPIASIERIYATEGDPNTEELGIRIVKHTGATPLEFYYADVKQPQQAWNTPRMNAARNLLQNMLDVRTPLANLDPADPLALADPATEWLFWDGTDLVQRDQVVEWVDYAPRNPNDPSDTPVLQWCIRRAVR